MSSKTPGELLYDSEATLRLVDSALREIAGQPHAASSPDSTSLPPELGLTAAAQILEQGYRELTAVLDSLRQSRSLLERATLDKLAHTGNRLREVSTATESAATDILNGIDRANGLVDELDACAESDDREKSAQLRAHLRDELFALMGHMQFQDITAQQLAYASAVLDEVEARLTALARVFEVPNVSLNSAASERPAPALTFDPNATTAHREQRQATADAVIAASSRRR